MEGTDGIWEVLLSRLYRLQKTAEKKSRRLIKHVFQEEPNDCGGSWCLWRHSQQYSPHPTRTNLTCPRLFPGLKYGPLPQRLRYNTPRCASNREERSPDGLPNPIQFGGEGIIYCIEKRVSVYTNVLAEKRTMHYKI